MSKFVVLGSKGTIGSALVKNLVKHQKEVISTTRENLDATNFDSIRKIVHENPDSVFINCIAFMPADKCETEVKASENVNFRFVDLITQEIAKFSNSKFIQLSTDFIFDGKTNIPYTTNSKPNPINIYGQHKMLAEKAVEDNLNDQAQIIRFASLVAKTGKGSTFTEKISQRAIEQGIIKVVEDLKISIATSTLVLDSILQASEFPSFGIHHAVHEGVTTWYELAKLTLELDGIEAQIEPISHLDLNLPATRPQYSALQPSKTFENTQLDWKKAVTNYLGSYE